LARRGPHIALTAGSKKSLHNVVKSLNEFGVKTMIVPVNLAQPARRHELISTVLDKFGAVITLMTGKNPFYSGICQVLFGLANATVTFSIGHLIGVAVTG
jgi:hypothetical protein